ncbi:uncharacterized protein F5891DRAFT_987955 [Suillus fuscotomentosus]|uniref:Uncharacterized protein n=1 Tax=Suillus fuscotomentosus TaxID=1912939 RepID=A0AAD4HCF2_9AGAM|nr:uncharacterized protein F5891DRAFT_987955 [Suillus fuscotomentosus]KAG1887947.1 hypothetical protein F5891DRAFT_987955 [Suillus fuscotomentosus]
MARSNSSVHSPQKTKQKLTEEELLVLQSHLEEWKEATGKDRKTILKAVIKEAKMQAPKMDARLLKKRKSFSKKWTTRLVIEHQYKKEILEKTRARPGGKEMIKHYQGAVNAIMAGLSEEQLDEANTTAIEWSSSAPPTDVQAEFAQKKAPGMMKDLATQLWRQAGMRIFILSAWKTEEGEVRINGRPDPVIRIDFNEKLEGNSFTDTKDWKSMLPEWNAYVGEEFAIDWNNDDNGNEDADGKESRNPRRKKEEFTLEVDAYGLPVIPDIEPLNLENKKSLIRTFLTKHYRFCSQKPKASVPWSAVTEAQENFIEPKFLPTSGKIKDPSKLQLHDADRLLQFWHQRQKDKVRPTFEFKGWQDHEKEMREPVEKISESDSSTTCSPVTAKTRVLVQKPTGRLTGKSSGKSTSRVEPESSSEGEDGEGEGENDEARSPPSKLKLTGKPKSTGKPGKAVQSIPVKKPPAKSTGKSSGKPAGRVEVESSGEEENGDEGNAEVQSPPPECQSIGKRSRAIKFHPEEDSGPLVKKSKSNVIGRNIALEDDAGTPSAESSSNHSTAPLPPKTASRSSFVGPASASQMKKSGQKQKSSQKIPAPKPTAPATTQGTGKKTQTDGAHIDKPEPKRSTRAAKVSYKVNYMQRA